MSDLAGLRVLVTRPAAQAASLCAAIEAANGVTLRLPLQMIVPVADQAHVRAALESARDADAWLFTSVNAVRQVLALGFPLDGGPRPATLAATGAATAAALRASGASDVLVPATHDGAAGLLALPRFADVHGQRLAVVGGEQPLPDLVDGLRARGAQVQAIAVYRRVPVTHHPDAVAQAIAASEVILLTNGEALHALLALTPPPLQPVLRSRPLALPSARVVELARRAGFTSDLRVPERVADADWLELLQSGLTRWRSVPPNDLR